MIQRLLQWNSILGDRLLEWVQVYHHEVDRLDLVFLQMGDVRWVVLDCKESTVDLRVQGFHSAVEDLRELGDF